MKMHDEGQVKWDFAQISLNFIDWHHAATGNPQAANGHSIYNELQKRGIPINAFDPLSGGALGSASRPVTRKMLQRRPNDSISSWAIRFVGSLPGILTYSKRYDLYGTLKGQPIHMFSIGTAI